MEASSDEGAFAPSHSQAQAPSRWARFAEAAQRDLKLWLVFMGLLSLCRLGLIVAFRGRMDPGTGFGPVLTALANGLRFDGQVATVWMAPSLLVGVVAAFTGWRRPPSAVRQVLAGLFIFTTVLLAVITYGYFREYGNQFDERVFGVVEDDFGAVLATVWKEYPATTVALVMLAFDAGLFFGVRWLVRRPWVYGGRLDALRPAWRAAAAAGLVVFLEIGRAHV